jgi:hypothetical protein
MSRFLSDLKWALLHKLHPRHRYHIVRTGLPVGYHKIDDRMLHACLARLVQFVEAEGGEAAIREAIDELVASPELWTGHTKGDPDAARAMEPHVEWRREVLALFHWWTIERPAIRAAQDAADASAEWARREDELEDEDQAMFLRLAAKRRLLWT